MNQRPTAFFQSLPKIELHRHLEGSVRMSTLVDVGRAYHLDLPGGEDLHRSVQISSEDPLTSQNFLSKFDVLRKFYRSPEVIERISEEAVADAAADNVRHLELRFTPVALGKAQGFPLGEVMDWVIEGVKKAQAKNAISICLIASINRHESVEIAAQVAALAAERRDSGIAGLDLAGDEARFPAAPFQPLLREARQSGLHLTIHAGEWGPAENVIQAISDLDAERIGHGVRVMDDPQAVTLAREMGTPFEVCLTSNYQSGVVNSIEHHPIGAMIQAGLNTTINTDDPTISQISLSSEYALFCNNNKQTLQNLRDQVATAAKAAFLPKEEREKLIVSLNREFEELISSH